MRTEGIVRSDFFLFLSSRTCSSIVLSPSQQRCEAGDPPGWLLSFCHSSGAPIALLKGEVRVVTVRWFLVCEVFEK